MRAWLLGSGLAFCVLATTHGAWAFCSAMSCDPTDAAQHCQVDSRTQCVLSGFPLLWASDCVTFSIQKDAAPKTGIDYDAAKSSLERAFATWTHAGCDGGAPSLRFTLSDPVTCDASEFNLSRANANILIFREDEWPYEGGEDALGLTRVRFDPDHDVGELWDADIEINAVSEPLSVGDPKADQVDLDSLITHEVGHALGLAHSLDLGATMIAGYVKGSIGLRSLGDDDIAGVCSSYPPTRKASSSSCEPRRGFSELCGADQPPPTPPVDTGGSGQEPGGSSKGCSLSAAATPRFDGWLALGAAALAGVGFAGRRRLRR